MTEEEKKAIEYFNADLEYLEEELKNPNYIGRFITIQDKEVEYLKIVLNLIEKQEKVIEYLKSQIPIDKIFYYSYKDFIPKDKIREKIIEDTAKMNTSVNIRLKKIYKTRIEFGEELLGDDTNE